MVGFPPPVTFQNSAFKKTLLIVGLKAKETPFLTYVFASFMFIKSMEFLCWIRALVSKELHLCNRYKMLHNKRKVGKGEDSSIFRRFHTSKQL